MRSGRATTSSRCWRRCRTPSLTTPRSRCGCCTSCTTSASRRSRRARVGPAAAPAARSPGARPRGPAAVQVRRACGMSFVEDFFEWVAEHDGVSLAAHVQRDADRDQVLELLRVRSLYHLQEADPTAWVVPRLGVRAKAALMELLCTTSTAPATPTACTTTASRSAWRPAASTPRSAPMSTRCRPEILEQNNTMSLFGLHRRRRAAALGHLAAFEATSSLPSRRMVAGLERLGFPDELVDYYGEHVEADAVHEQLAVRTIVGGSSRRRACSRGGRRGSGRSPASISRTASAAGCSSPGASASRRRSHDVRPSRCRGVSPEARCCCAATTSSRTPTAYRSARPAR